MFDCGCLRSDLGSMHLVVYSNIYLCNKGSCEDNHIFWIYFLSVVGCPLVKKRKKSQDNSLSKVPKQDEKIVAVKSDSIK